MAYKSNHVLILTDKENKLRISIDHETVVVETARSTANEFDIKHTIILDCNQATHLAKMIDEGIERFARILQTETSADDIFTKVSTDNIFTLEEWKKYVLAGAFNEEDGTGYWLKNSVEMCDNNGIPMTNVWGAPPKGATHVAWYNK